MKIPEHRKLMFAYMLAWLVIPAMLAIVWNTVRIHQAADDRWRGEDMRHWRDELQKRNPAVDVPEVRARLH